MSDDRKSAVNAQEIILGGCILAASAFLLGEAADFPARSTLFPKAVLWCMVAVGAGLIIVPIARAMAGQPSLAERVAWFSGILAPSSILVAAAVSLALFGFYVTSPLLILAIHTYHKHRSTRDALAARSLAAGVGLALGSTAVMYLVFSVVIGLPAPSGALF